MARQSPNGGVGAAGLGLRLEPQAGAVAELGVATVVEGLGQEAALFDDQAARVVGVVVVVCAEVAADAGVEGGEVLKGLDDGQKSAIGGLHSRLALVAETQGGLYMRAAGSDGIDLERSLRDGEIVRRLDRRLPRGTSRQRQIVM